MTVRSFSASVIVLIGLCVDPLPLAAMRISSPGVGYAGNNCFGGLVRESGDPYDDYIYSSETPGSPDYYGHFVTTNGSHCYQPIRLNERSLRSVFATYSGLYERLYHTTRTSHTNDDPVAEWEKHPETWGGVDFRHLNNKPWFRWDLGLEQYWDPETYTFTNGVKVLNASDKYPAQWWWVNPDHYVSVTKGTNTVLVPIQLHSPTNMDVTSFRLAEYNNLERLFYFTAATLRSGQFGEYEPPGGQYRERWWEDWLLTRMDDQSLPNYYIRPGWIKSFVSSSELPGWTGISSGYTYHAVTINDSACNFRELWQYFPLLNHLDLGFFSRYISPPPRTSLARELMTPLVRRGVQFTNLDDPADDPYPYEWRPKLKDLVWDFHHTNFCEWASSLFDGAPFFATGNYGYENTTPPGPKINASDYAALNKTLALMDVSADPVVLDNERWRYDVYNRSSSIRADYRLDGTYPIELNYDGTFVFQEIPLDPDITNNTTTNVWDEAASTNCYRSAPIGAYASASDQKTASGFSVSAMTESVTNSPSWTSFLSYLSTNDLPASVWITYEPVAIGGGYVTWMALSNGSEPEGVLPYDWTDYIYSAAGLSAMTGTNAWASASRYLRLEQRLQDSNRRQSGLLEPRSPTNDMGRLLGRLSDSYKRMPALISGSEVLNGCVGTSVYTNLNLTSQSGIVQRGDGMAFVRIPTDWRGRDIDWQLLDAGSELSGWVDDNFANHASGWYPNFDPAERAFEAAKTNDRGTFELQNGYYVATFHITGYSPETGFDLAVTNLTYSYWYNNPTSGPQLVTQKLPPDPGRIRARYTAYLGINVPGYYIEPWPGFSADICFNWLWITKWYWNYLKKEDY